MTLDLARWQFAITTVYHFFFVPLTIGLSLLVAGMQTAWVRTGDEHYLRMTKFWGKLFLINFAMGVVTGIVQEFQFGMNWSDYSRFVGDIFGAPLAIEGLLAFFLESTFLGLWIFGWDRLPKRLHLACIWLASIGTAAVGVLHPGRELLDAAPGRVGVNPATGRAELTDIGAVLTNSTALGAFPHTITAAFLTAGRVHAGDQRLAPGPRPQIEVFRPSLRLAPGAVLIAGIGVVVHRRPAGPDDDQAAADEDGRRRGALRHRQPPASFSLFTIGSLDGVEGGLERCGCPACCRSWPPAPSTARSRASTTCSAQYEQTYGPGDYMPVIPVTYWSFRLMIGLRAAGRAVSRARPVADPPAATRRRAALVLLAAARRAGHCRCRPTASAGSSPRWAASRGWCSACCAPPTASPQRRRRLGADLAGRVHRCCTARSPSSTAC